jgi:hypothetical protein
MEQQRQPYVPPRLLRVQKRMAGDNMAGGCMKDPSPGGPNSTPCDTGAEPCMTVDPS